MDALAYAEELKTLLMREPRWTVATAESLTCGHVQALIGSISGASHYFLGGVTAYTLEQKVSLLQVRREDAAPVNSVSELVAQQMAVGACHAFQATWAVSTTGYAEASPVDGVRQPFAWIAVAAMINRSPFVSARRVVALGQSRDEVQREIAAAAVEHLVITLRAKRRA
jgi:nicotinamide-nucleotide amidase